MQLATTLWSKSATFHVQLGVLSCTVNRACVSASLGRSVHVVVSLRKSTTDTYLWGRPDSGCLTRARCHSVGRPPPPPPPPPLTCPPGQYSLGNIVPPPDIIH